MDNIRKNLRLTRLTLTLMALATAIALMASRAVDKFVAAPSTDPQNISVVVLDLKNKKVLESYNADVPLIPASITKAVTIASTLGATGANYRYHTPVYIDGPVRDGVLEGNLIVIGSGDPTINSKVAPQGADFVQETINALKSKGIKRIKGRLLFDQSVFPGPATHPTWASGDLKNDYGTGVHGFNFENNTSGKASVANPALTFETRLKAAMKNNGMSFDWEELPQPKRTLLFEHVSPTIDDIMRSCMRRSDNMFAETLLRTLAVANRKSGTTDNGAAIEKEYWRKKGAHQQGVNIVDGSGLSRSNRITAQFMTDMLENMANNADYVSFFPLAGQEGTVRNFLKDTDLDSFIALKTGSMNGIQCYAGYKLDYDFNPTHVVVVMVNNMRGDRGKLRKDIETMLLEIFSNVN